MLIILTTAKTMKRKPEIITELIFCSHRSAVKIQLSIIQSKISQSSAVWKRRRGEKLGRLYLFYAAWLWAHGDCPCCWSNKCPLQENSAPLVGRAPLPCSPVPARVENTVTEVFHQGPGSITLISRLFFTLGWPLALLLLWQGFCETVRVLFLHAC